jgi:hypothetical protein
MNHLPRRALTICIAALAACLCFPSRARGEEVAEYQLKAAFLYNFVQFTEWPASAFSGADDPIVIGVVGPNPFGDALERAVKDKVVSGRRLTVRYFSTPEEVDACHAVFVPAAETGGRSVLNRTANKAILTIGDGEDFTKAGGIIRFYRDKNRIRFEVNVKAADRAKLKVSAKLMKLAAIYEE